MTIDQDSIVWNESRQRWIVKILKNNKAYLVGYFKEEAKARQAFEDAKTRLND